MKILYKASLFCATVFALSSCNLELMPSSSISISEPSDAFVTMDDVEALQNGLNYSFRTVQQGIFWYTTEVQGDMFNATLDFGNRNGAPHTMGDAFTASDYNIADYWDYMYYAIAQNNVFLDGVYTFMEDESLSADDVALVKVYTGNAYFYRAFCYAKLAATFADDYEPSTASSKLGVPLCLTYDPLARPARATLSETYAQIQSDIDSAKKYLANTPGVVRSEVPTIDAVNALDARVKLALHDYTGAAAAADLVISTGNYQLSQTVAELQTELQAQTGTESVMLMYCTMSETTSSNSIFINYSSGKYSPDFLPTSTLVNSYIDTDIRKEGYFTSLDINIAAVDYSGFTVFSKYIGNPALTSQSYHACVTKPRIFGIAEMYLIKAEAEVRSGSSTATTTLNALQTARGATLTEGTLANIQTEWGKETVGEGLRIECLKRWGLGFTNRTPIDESIVYTISGYSNITVSADEPKLTWAIPATDIKINENLEQNAGW